MGTDMSWTPRHSFLEALCRNENMRFIAHKIVLPDMKFCHLSGFSVDNVSQLLLFLLIQTDRQTGSQPTCCFDDRSPWASRREDRQPPEFWSALILLYNNSSTYQTNSCFAAEMVVWLSTRMATQYYSNKHLRLFEVSKLFSFYYMMQPFIDLIFGTRY